VLRRSPRERILWDRADRLEPDCSTALAGTPRDLRHDRHRVRPVGTNGAVVRVSDELAGGLARSSRADEA